MSDIQAVLDQIKSYPGKAGALLATADGLLMACAGALHGDMAAAAAAGLVLAGKEALAALAGQPSWGEQLIWSGDQVWYQTQLCHTHVLLLVSDDPSQAGTLRWSGRRMAGQLEAALRDL
jgi:predicted regulator of Ras-like GTPase activity (Roadblock/LC7/MglB family)